MRRRSGVLMILLAAVGCYVPSPTQPTEPRKPVYPVRGQVFVHGRPAAGAFVLFYPAHEPDEPKAPRPQATVRLDGSFTLGTYEADDGAPAGNYIVTVIWPPDEQSDEDLLEGRYADRTRPKLTTVVLKGPNELPPFRLE